MKELNFSIPSPCTQNFSKMKKDEKGRYCDSCAKHVVDFSNRSKEEIIEYLLQKKQEEVCGTFKKEQLDNTSTYVYKRKLSFGFLSFAIIAFLSNLLVSCRVYRPTLGPVMLDKDGAGTGKTSAGETTEEHLNSIHATCPPEHVLGGSIVIAPPSPPIIKKDSIIQKKDSVIVTKRKIWNDTTFIHFPSGNYELNTKEKNQLTAFAKVLKANPKMTISICGYTDGTGSIFTNQMVSRRRAEAVREFLREQKVENTIQIKAYGIKNPVGDNKTEEGKALNRRAEIIILEE